MTQDLEQARDAKASQKLNEMLEEGLNSGPPIQFTPLWWKERKAELLASLPSETEE